MLIKIQLKYYVCFSSLLFYSVVDLLNDYGVKRQLLPRGLSW